MKEAVLRAVKKAKETSKPRNFTQSMEMSINLQGLDMKKTQNRIKEDFVLPNGRGKDVKIGIFASGDMAQRAKKENLSIFDQEDIDKLAKDKKLAKKVANSHDFFIAQTDFMTLIGKSLGPIFAPRGKTPAPLPPTAPLEPILNKMKKTVKIKSYNQSVIHMFVGSEKMEDEMLAENISEIIKFFEKKLEKGYDNIKSIYIKTSMGPAVKLEDFK
ncbi:MAG: 50S ribosomal protein L1 [Candidatus Methanofastidiosum sp.]|nr:50S ribosomal protein L1 [Methanofastidiosum sp.]